MQDKQNTAPRLKRQNEDETLKRRNWIQIGINSIYQFGSYSLAALLLPLHSLNMGLLTEKSRKKCFPGEMTREGSEWEGSRGAT